MSDPIQEKKTFREQFTEHERAFSDTVYTVSTHVSSHATLNPRLAELLAIDFAQLTTVCQQNHVTLLCPAEDTAAAAGTGALATTTPRELAKQIADMFVGSDADDGDSSPRLDAADIEDKISFNAAKRGAETFRRAITLRA